MVQYTQIQFDSVEDLLKYQASNKEAAVTVAQCKEAVPAKVTSPVTAGRRSVKNNIDWSIPALKSALLGKRISYSHWNQGTYEDKAGIVDAVGPEGESGWFGETSVSIRFKGMSKPVVLYKHELSKATIE